MSTASDYSDGTPQISFTLRDSAGNALARRAGERIFYAASTIKLAVAMAAIEEIGAGRLTWKQTVPATHTFESAAGGTFSLADDPEEADNEIPEAGTPMSVRELLDAMIDRSSNEATDMLLGLIGIPRVQRLCKEQGMHRLHIERLIGDIAARNRGLPNEVTTDDLSKLMLAAVHGDWSAHNDIEVLRQALSRQRYAVIASELPHGVAWGSKSGSVDGIEHDVAFVGDPDSADLRVLAVCTRGYAPDDAHEAIRAVAAAALGD
ncbi:serine hydrolase [Bifidobacterium sp.]|jgi:beta-lactamase class A|uniref:serine hydrolase n=1 Tax=Bifidobacterium sp. TaxID=41200 RepID=UPI0025C1F96E|nr:serine hydrolase [Bifidobacterium sp.]MCH4209345.1 class A beta-lactamase-related serine hydrolase [Bifidobacterium sp.]MCI1224139.1 class A beta-lactamase-related serine hydrolase [Bifidobacterium sp.]